MPNQDGTGPQGTGPKTGRGLGPCDNKQGRTPDQRQPGRGMGRGRRQGFGQQTPRTQTDK